MIYLLSLCLGLVSGLPMIFDFLFVLPIFTFGGIFYISLKCRYPYLNGLLFSVGYYAMAFHWLTNLYPMDFAGFSNGMSVVIISLGIGFMSLVQGVGTAFVFLLFRRLYSKERKWLAAFTGASLFTLAEWGQNFFWFGIPWARLALSQTGVLENLQTVSVFGTLFTAFLLTFISSSFALAFADGPKQVKKQFIITGLCAYIANFGFGLVKINLPDGRGKMPLTVAAIQGNISSVDKWADDSLENSTEIYTSLTRKAVGETGADLVLWPESVITSNLNMGTRTSGIISSLALELDCDIAVGAYYSDENGTSNAIYMFRRDGTVDGTVYKKRHLVPFGEYIPMRSLVLKIFPFLENVNMFSSELTPGTDSEILTGSGYGAGALVCFDSIYPSLARDSARDSAEVILISTNDSWYGTSAGVYEHRNQAILRAIENGLPVVRAANTGVSAIIDGKGRIVSELGPLTDGYTSAEIEIVSTNTVYSCLGDVFAWISVAVVTASVALKIFDCRREKKNADSSC